MTGGSLGLRTGSYGSLQQQVPNGLLQTQTSFIVRKPSKMVLSGSRERERFIHTIRRYLARGRVGMFTLFAFALLAFALGFFAANREAAGNTSLNTAQQVQNMGSYVNMTARYPISISPRKEDNQKENGSRALNNVTPPPPPPHAPVDAVDDVHFRPLGHQCDNFAFPPPPPPDRRRIGPRPCPVCYLPVEQAMRSMPSSPSASPVLRNLTYVLDENPLKTERHGGPDFGGYPSLKQRNDSFDMKESMTVHCGFVKGNKPGRQTGFDIDEADLTELEQSHEVIVASAIFGNYDIIQQPQNISEIARKNVPFYMFIDEETEAFMKNSSALDSTKRVGLWRIVVVRNTPYMDARRNGKVPKLLLHRIFPNVRYSIWIDGKLQLVVDPYQILERFLWRSNASFAISRHYRRFDVFEEAEANKLLGNMTMPPLITRLNFIKRRV
ncbi:hypothetical protein L1049_001279 [Liquidambar formosana]|uniref:TOD1/MUCI70 glycosyltransferase-like domain-containing protein n=1 Tax=Liquidambar formosana TaxID=63359 RepID=A0AAP0R632_LIQFO